MNGANDAALDVAAYVVPENMTSPIWTEISIATTSAGLESVCAVLMDMGISGFVIQDPADFEAFLADKSPEAPNWDYVDDQLNALREGTPTVTFYLPDNLQGRETFAGVQSAMFQLKNSDQAKETDFGPLSIACKGVREEDWANNWKQYFKPLTVGNTLVIKPSWEEYQPWDGRIVLEIDPASSFGTGQHQTTQLCLTLLEGYLQKGCRLLDLGCGSGILSIAGVLLGAKQAVAVDILENCAETAKENAMKNGISPEQYQTYWGNILTDQALVDRLGEGYDLITANIVADVLIGMRRLLNRFLRPGGVAVLSGIIGERAEEVLKSMEETGLVLAERREQEDWVALAMLRPADR